MTEICTVHSHFTQSKVIAVLLQYFREAKLLNKNYFNFSPLIFCLIVILSRALDYFMLFLCCCFKKKLLLLLKAKSEGMNAIDHVICEAMTNQILFLAPRLILWRLEDAFDVIFNRHGKNNYFYISILCLSLQSLAHR